LTQAAKRGKGTLTSQRWARPAILIALVRSDNETMLLMEQVANDQPTFFPFDLPPKRVLDLGCGDGSWIMRTMSKWPVCQIRTFLSFTFSLLVNINIVLPTDRLPSL
jgi:hypothetical protein